MYYHKTKYQLLTFYQFVDIPETEVDGIVRDHLQFCKDIDLRGRVYIGTEGISSTVSGNIGQLKAYQLYLKTIPYFADIEDIEVKATHENGHCFDKMFVKQRDEIVKLGKKYTAEEIKAGGNRMTTEELKKVIDEGNEDYVILDMRNDYEYNLGHFKGAVPAGTVNFRELDSVLERYKKLYPNKKIVTYCTGGIRCEKATVMMQEAGMTDVYQLDGGVMKYVNKHNDGNWLGNLYVFDGRESMHVGDENTHTTIGVCMLTGEKTDYVENCRHSACNARLICTEEAYKKQGGFCSEECYLKAKDSLLIKNSSFDKYDYKKARKTIKHKPEMAKEILETTLAHLDTFMKDTSFFKKDRITQDDHLVEVA